MNKIQFLLSIALLLIINTYAQNGMNFQGVARNGNGIILASQPIAVRLSVLQGSVTGNVLYQETKTVTTNAQGIFNIVIGDATGAISTTGSYQNIAWNAPPHFIRLEMDPAAGNNFMTLGTTQFQYVAYAQFSNGVAAENITGIVPVARGGTGANSLSNLKNTMNLDKVNNTADAEKPISAKTKTALDLKLNSEDTIKYTKQIWADSALLTKINITDTTNMLNNRIGRDTLNLSARINVKANTTDVTTSLALKENTSNKSNAVDLGGLSPSDVLYPTQKAVKAYVTANVSSGGVADGGITTIKLADGAVTDAKITSINASKITDATTANIAPSINRNYVTDVQSGVLSNTSGINTGDETISTIKTKLSITTLSGVNTGDQTIGLTGDVIGTGTGTFTTTLSNTGVTAGTYGSSTAIPVLTIDGKGRITNVSTSAVSGGENIDASNLAGTTLANNITSSSLTGLGTITSGTWSGTVISSNLGGAGSITGLLKANGFGLVSSADMNDIPNLSSRYIQTNDGSQPAQNANILLTGGANFGFDMIVSGHQLGIGLNDRYVEHNNLAFGKNALLYNFGSIGNTSIGANSSLTNNGNNNTALGIYANSGIPDGFEFNNYQYGDNNTAIGAYALTHNNNHVYIPSQDYYVNELFHSSNTAIGAYSLSNIINGYSNISIGVNAGKNITDGTKNILIGDSAGINTTNQYYNAIALGVKAPLKGSNTIQLGSDGSNSGDAVTHVYTSGKLVSGNVTYPNIAGLNGQFLTINNGIISFTDLPSLTNIIQNSESLSSPQNASISISGNLTTLQDATINGIKIGKGGGSISSNNVIGYNALSSNTTGNKNIAFGYNALSSNTLGYGNIGIGFNSLYTNTYGANNIAIGVNSQNFNNGQNNISLGTDALFSNTTGNSNIAIGNSSLKSNQIGSQNISIGNSVLYNNLNGFGNIALGQNNLFDNTTGYHNISLGTQNLFRNIDGYNNIAFGSSSLQANSSGNNNISFGALSMNLNTLGNQNIAIGENALSRNTTGNNNIAIGKNAMTWNTTGSYNITLNGDAFGSYNTAIGSSSFVQGGNNNTALGYGARTPFNESNIIVLGNTDITEVRTNGKLRLGPVLYPNFTAQSGTVLMMGSDSEAYWENLPSNNNDVTALTNSITSNTYSITSLTNSVTSNTYSITSLTNSVNSNTYSITSLTNSVNSNTYSITSLTNNAVPYSGANRQIDLGNFDLKVNGILVGAGDNTLLNTLVGKDALFNNTTGQENTAVGFRTLYSNTTGYANVAIGTRALKSHSTGNSNVAIGLESLSSNIYGQGNIGLGTFSLYANTGDNNFAFGTFSLYSNTTGTDNIAIGNQTLNVNTTGSRNIQIGGNNSNTTGSNNVFIGGTGVGEISNNNTAIGYYSGINGQYSNTTVIGYGAGAYQSNSVFLGNSNVTHVISNGAFSSSSDRRIKKEVEVIAYGLNTINKLNPVKFKFIQNNQIQIGFIAQELKDLIPELVGGKEGDINKGEILSVAYPNMVAVLTKALQEEDRKVTNLEKEIIALKNELEALKNILKNAKY